MPELSEQTAGVEGAGRAQRQAPRGIDRAWYFSASLILWALPPAVFLGVLPDLDLVFELSLLGWIVVTALRLRNTGSGFLWVVLLILPPLNFLVLYRCLAVPPGFAQTGRWDRASKLITAIIFLGLALIWVSVYWG